MYTSCGVKVKGAGGSIRERETSVQRGVGRETKRNQSRSHLTYLLHSFFCNRETKICKSSLSPNLRILFHSCQHNTDSSSCIPVLHQATDNSTKCLISHLTQCQGSLLFFFEKYHLKAALVCAVLSLCLVLISKSNVIQDG